MKHAAAAWSGLASFLLAASTTAVDAQAQTVYRCANTYSQAPCPAAKAIDVGDPRTDEQRTQSERVTEGQRQLALEMRRDRMVDEAAHKPARAGSLSGPPARKARPVQSPARRRIYRAMRPALQALDREP